MGVATGVLDGCAEAAGVGEVVRVGTAVDVPWWTLIEGTGVARGDFTAGCGRMRAENGVAVGATCRCGNRVGESTSSVVKSKQVMIASIHSRRRRVDCCGGTDFPPALDRRASGETGTIISVE